ncbi:MAG: TetR/AcrR family transcriptional regulator [Henriciella sp.]|nr:TetR/AcrR family transcriptional regulator [Henriciella sp.]
MTSSTPRQGARKPVRSAKQKRAKATVEVIIEAATRILSDQGWDALNTNTIARRAGVSVGSLYEYFPNKQAILDVILDRHLSKGDALIAQGAKDVQAGATTAQDVVDLLVSGFVRLHSDDPKLHRALSADVPLSKAQHRRVEAVRERIIDLTAAALADKVSAPAMKATLLVDTADALTHKWLIDDVGTPVSAETLAQELKTMLGLYALA